MRLLLCKRDSNKGWGLQNLLSVKDGDGRESKDDSKGRADMVWEKELIKV